MNTDSTEASTPVDVVVSTALELANAISSGLCCFCILRDTPEMKMLPRHVLAVDGDNVLIDCWEQRLIAFDSPLVERWQCLS